jgi:hypothetical protein
MRQKMLMVHSHDRADDTNLQVTFLRMPTGPVSHRYGSRALNGAEGARYVRFAELIGSSISTPIPSSSRPAGFIHIIRLRRGEAGLLTLCAERSAARFSYRVSGRNRAGFVTVADVLINDA